MSLLNRDALPLRHARQAGESLHGYVYRLYNANGHDVPAEVHADFSILYSDARQAQREAAAAKIAAIAGGLKATDWPQWPKWHSWLKQTYARFRFCPICLGQQAIHRSIWELPLVHTCPVHGTRLREECSCRKKLNWRLLGPDWRCRCGQLLKELDSAAASAGLVTLSQTVAACSSHIDSIENASAWQLPSEITKLSLAEIYAEINFLHRLDVKLNQHLGETVMSKVPAESVGLLLSNWPRNFNTYVRDWISKYFGKDRGAPLVRLSRNMPIVKTLGSRRGSLQELPLPLIVPRRLEELVQTLRVPVSWQGIFLINPAIGAQLNEAWLRDFYAQTDRRNDHAMGIEKGLPANTDSRQAKVLRQVISRFITEAVAGHVVSRFRRTALAWPLFGECRGKTALEWLAHLVEPLYSASYAHLCYLRETLEVARSHGREPRDEQQH